MQIINCTRFKRLSGSALARMVDGGPVLVASHYREDSEGVTGTPLFLLAARPRDERDVDKLTAQLLAWLAEGSEGER